MFQLCVCLRPRLPGRRQRRNQRRPPAAVPVPVPVPEPEPEPETVLLLQRAPTAELFGDLFPTEHGTSSQPFSQVVEEEVQHYRSVQSLSVESNPLVWWKDNEEQFPHLAKLAKRFLGIPATSVPSERVFSTAGERGHCHSTQSRPLTRQCGHDAVLKK